MSTNINEITTDQGAQMIVDLQALVKKKEPIARARKAWDNFSDQDKKATLRTHKVFCQNSTILQKP